MMQNIIDFLRNYLRTDDRVTVRGEVALKVYKDEALIEDSVDKNLVVTLGRNNIARLIGGGGGYAITDFKAGTSGTAAAAGDSSITSPFSKAITTVSYPVDGTVQFDFSIELSEANGKAIQEFGLFDSDGVMFARKTRAVINKDNTIRIVGTWKIIF
jgi:hypothetical protein